MKAYVLANTYISMVIALLSATKELERTKISINCSVDIQQDSSININCSEKKKKTKKSRDKTWLSGARRKGRKWGMTADGYKVYWGKGIIFFLNYFMRLAAQLL